MIDPIIFSFKVGSIEFALRWYGVLIMTAVLAASWLTAQQVRKRGGDPAVVWDGLVVILLSGIVGARLWYVLNATLGGSRYYLETPVKILAITEGGLHIFGAFLFGGLAAYFYARSKKVDIWLLLDSVAPALLIGQAMARPANFINQELYGPPTTLPWGISINANHRMAPWNDLLLYPEETTRFHPTFAYEIVWNLLAAGLLIWVANRYADRLKPGTIFMGWLVLAGTGRFLVEAFRPDQPLIPGTGLSYSTAHLRVDGALWNHLAAGTLQGAANPGIVEWTGEV